MSVDSGDRLGAGSNSQPPDAELSTAQPQDVAPASRPESTSHHSGRRLVKCRFFASRKGCRSGDACPYLHDASTVGRKRSPPEGSLTPPVHGSSSANGSVNKQDCLQGVTTDLRNMSMNDAQSESGRSASASSLAFQRPVSKLENQNPREFQINQLRRRFHPQEKADDTGLSLTFEMVPSDPDFPFELDKLQCVLHVPLTYPSSGRPTLKVTNPEMDEVFQANVARGFHDIVDSTLRTNGRRTLLGWLNSLDRHLERLLTTTERGPTLKFIANVGGMQVSERKESAQSPTVQTQLPPSRHETPIAPAAPQPAIPRRTYTAEEKGQAEKRRKEETKQIEARLGRLPQFRKSPDGLSFVIPIQPTKPNRLPLSLRSVKTVKLLVPLLYPLEHSFIELQGVENEAARPVETGFAEWVGDNSNLNLMSQINFLASNMHAFANRPVGKAPEIAPAEVSPPGELNVPQGPAGPAATNPVEQLDDRSHIHVIPRPPEWSVPDTGSGSEVTDESDYDEDYTDEDVEEGGAPVPEIPESKGRGVALSFPSLELYGIELLELVNIYVTVKCERCKEHMDVKNIRPPKSPNEVAAPRLETCKKCANPMSIGFRRQLMHLNSNRAGYLDLDGCTVVDLLPSNFIPTCAECSTAFPAPGVTTVRGESATATCRECHRKMVLKIPEVKFLVVGAAAASARAAAPQRKKPKEVLGIVAGQELPRRGRCSHYGKSYRWFRFGCCAKVFPCDKCHDQATDHPNEHANRMICGFCSREQIYRPEDCGICRAVLVGKAGSGFWEGGKGTRSKVLMSRKDPRKYKRRGGTTPGGASSSKKK